MSGVTFQLLLALGGLAKLTLLDHDFTGNVPGASSHNFSMDCGDGGDVVLGAHIFTSGNFGTVTIGGVTATQEVVADLGASGSNSGIFTASGVPSGTQTVSIGVSGGSGVSTRFAAELYKIEGHASLTPDSTATDTSHTTGSPAATLNVPAGAAALGVAMELGGTATAASWSGLTEDVDDSASSTIYTSASDSFPGGDASLSTSVSFTGGTTLLAVGAWAVWKAA